MMKSEKIAALLRELAVALEAIADEEVKPKTDEKYTFEEVRTALSAKSGAGFTAQVRELLNKHCGARLSEVPESEYPELMKEVQEIGSTQ